MRNARQDLGWSHETLAEKAGLDQAHIRRCEVGKRSAALETIYLLAEALGVDATNLLPPPISELRERAKG